jgi:hypothetical protein
MSRSKRLLIALTVAAASLVQASEAFAGMNHNETLLKEGKWYLEASGS